jgi:cell division septal protein FtsQ
MRPNTHDEKRLLGGRKAEDQSRRRSVLMITAAWLLALGLILFSSLLFTAGARRLFLTANPHFTLKHVDIEGPTKNDKLLLTDIEALKEDLQQSQKNFELGRVNLFTLDLASIREKTLKLPATRACTVERLLPDTLRITIFEKRPVARIVSEGTMLLCSLDGSIMPKNEGNFDHLPVIQPSKPSRLQPGSEIEDPAVLTALRYLQHAGTWWREFDGRKIFPEAIFTPTFIKTRADGTLCVTVAANPDCRLQAGVTLYLNAAPYELELSIKRALDWVLHNRDEGGKVVTEYIEATVRAPAGR